MLYLLLSILDPAIDDISIGVLSTLEFHGDFFLNRSGSNFRLLSVLYLFLEGWKELNSLIHNRMGDLHASRLDSSMGRGVCE